MLRRAKSFNSWSFERNKQGTVANRTFADAGIQKLDEPLPRMRFRSRNRSSIRRFLHRRTFNVRFRRSESTFTESNRGFPSMRIPAVLLS